MGGAVPETSYYGALTILLNEIGKTLKPKVRAVSQLMNTGAGAPDFGLFTQQQFTHARDAEPMPGQLPQRGAIEVKGTSDDVFDWSKWPDPEQVPRYVERYGLVLVTNLRDFVLVGRGPGGEPILKESCRLSETEDGFWAKAAQPRKYAEEAGEGLVEFLKRVMLHKVPLLDPKDVAWFLASYARTARLRLEHRDLPALAQLREQLEEALGLKFEGEKGDHFFRSTLVQTLFYGMFASWVLWTREQATTEAGKMGRFEWETASSTLHVPMVSELFWQFSNPGKLRDLEIAEVLEWAEDVFNRVNRTEFFSRFQEHHGVQYFYEPFLEEFDPQLRKELGVWYTPDEVVRYMVARVDWALREELDIADGLADPSVYVLDPCCGTGAYLVEVLRKIDETLMAKGADALTRQDVKRAAMERVIGFEIMPAPFVIAHLQLGLLLSEFGVPLAHGTDAHERAAVYLTNALTGWGNGEESKPVKVRVKGGGLHEAQMHSTLLLPEFAEERDAAGHVKRETPILVVLGNPPYNGYAGVAVDEERELSDVYRTTKRAPKPQGQGLNDLYVRFYRMAERQIAERAGRGVVCLITNNSWLDSLSFTGMRERFLEGFDGIWIDNLNGDKYKTGKLTPDGNPDPSIFSTEKNREGIQVGTAITLLVRADADAGTKSVEYRELWGEGKRARLDAEALGKISTNAEPIAPAAELGLPFVPTSHDPEYLEWPTLPELFPASFPGVQAKRDDLVVDVDREALVGRMLAYFDSGVSNEKAATLSARAMLPTARYDPVATRAHLVKRGFLPRQLVRYAYRPFDLRWIYWEPETRLLGEKSPRYFAQVFEGNAFLFATGRTRKPQAEPAIPIQRLTDLNYMDSGARGFPLYVVDGHDGLNTEDASESCRPNISAKSAAYLSEHDAGPADMLSHCAAVIGSRAYRVQNTGALRHDWPRVPLPGTRAVLQSSARLGCRLAALLNPETPVDGVTEGPLPAELVVLGVLERVGGGQLDPATDLAVTARWGIPGRGGVCMPSTGKLTERDHTADERAAIAEGARSLNISTDQVIELLGETCFDVYLNDVAYWRCVPANVWRYTIGGYQVIKKWLSYREKALLGRDLKPEEARYVTEMVRRIAALVLMQPELDANYERVKSDTFDWSSLE